MIGENELKVYTGILAMYNVKALTQFVWNFHPSKAYLKPWIKLSTSLLQMGPGNLPISSSPGVCWTDKC